MSMSIAKRYLAAGTALLLVGCLGCGTGQYEKELEKTVQRIGKESAFSAMGAPVKFTDTPVTVQLPMFLGEPLPQDTDEKRLQMPSIEIPDLEATYEGTVADSEGGQVPFYCYLAAVEGNPQRTVQQNVQNAFTGQVLHWDTTDCKTPTGGSVEWKILQATGIQQEFYYVDKDGQGTFRNMDSKVLVYLRDEGGLSLIIVWRLPVGYEKFIGSEGDLGLDKWASRVAGSVVVQ